MEPIFKLGDMLTVESKMGIVRGIVVDINSSFTRITMAENLWLATKILIQEPRHYYENDIVSLKVEYTKDELTQSSYTNSSQRLLNVHDYFHIQHLSTNYNFMDSDHGGRIRKAIAVLEKYDHIGLHGELSHHGKWGTLHVLILTTPNQIYMFDVLALMKLNLFKSILENKQIQKLVYNSNALIYILKSKYDISLSNVYDMMNIHLYISLKQEGRRFNTRPRYADCVAKYLGSKDLLIRDRLDKSNRLSLRPLSQAEIIIMAENAAYIHVLSQNMDDALLKPFMDLSANRLKESR